MFFVYILQSQKNGRFYIGQTNNPEQRLIYHNSGRVRSTKSGSPWKIVLLEEFEKRSESMSREKQIKSMKSGNEFQKLLAKY